MSCIRKVGPAVREEVLVLEAPLRKTAPGDQEVRATMVRDPAVPDLLLADLMDPGPRAVRAADRDLDDGEPAAAVGQADLPRSRESSTMRCRSTRMATESSIAQN